MVLLGEAKKYPQIMNFLLAMSVGEFMKEYESTSKVIDGGIGLCSLCYIAQVIF
jgi:hypothetical protein